MGGRPIKSASARKAAALRDDEERGASEPAALQSKISADAPPCPWACDTVCKYAGDCGTEGL
jgi:hypothetical protein